MQVKIHTFSWEYLAGFFDGEGSVYTHPTKKNNMVYLNFRVYLSQSGDRGRDLLESAIEWLRAFDIESKVYEQGIYGSTKLTPYTLRICQKPSVRRFLMGVRPFLNMKAERVDDFLLEIEAYEKSLQTRNESTISQVATIESNRLNMFGSVKTLKGA